MMKKIISFTLFFIVFCININVLAWNGVGGGVKYEITYLKIDNCKDSEDVCANIKGWAILPLGLEIRGFTPFKNQSGVVANNSNGSKDSNNNEFDSGYCKYGSKPFYDLKKNTKLTDSGSKDEGYLYQYKLFVYDKNGKELGNSGNNSNITFTRRAVSLTYLQAYKGGNLGRLGSGWKETACYEDVGFSYDINLSKLSAGNNEFSFKLSIQTGSKSGCKNGKCSATIPISVITAPKDSLSGQIDSKSLINTVSKVKNYMDNGYTWGTANQYGTKAKKYAIQPNEVFDVLERVVINDVSWYRIKVNGNSNRWIPASWTEPVTSKATIIKPNIVVRDPDNCSTNLSEGIVNKNCEKCNDNVRINFTDEEKCLVKETSSDFYSISCNQIIDTKFNPGNLSIKPGQGFYYGVDVTSTKKCVGKFDKDKWLESYNLAKNKRNNYDKNTADYKKYNNKITDLINVVKAYNNWNVEDTNNPVGIIEINYNDKGISKKISYEFENTIKNAGKVTIDSKEVSLNIQGLKNPVDFTSTNESNKRVINLSPPHVYLNRQTGEITTDEINGIDGGYNFYTNLNSDPGNFGIKISITNLGHNGKSSITNDKCPGTFTEVSDLYRIINESNPFVNDKRKENAGENWINDLFDFTGVIARGKNPLYTFNLSKNDIALIKISNIKDNKEKNKKENPYLGTCYKPINMQDEVMKPICAEINKYD